jgi:hypothetical protein
VIIEFDTTFTNELYPKVVDWLETSLSFRTSSKISWRSENTIHPRSYLKDRFDNICNDYKELVPSDSNLPINEILCIGGATWHSFRIKYFDRKQNGTVLTLEKGVVVLDNADAIMLKLTLGDVKIKVHDEDGETA